MVPEEIKVQTEDPINVENDKEQTGKADFSLSDNAFKFALTYVASLANKAGVGSKMAQEFPNGKCEGCEKSEWVAKVGNAITGAKVSMLFGGKQNNGKWYAQAHLFGGVSTANEAGVAELEVKRQALQTNEKFMVAEKTVEPTTTPSVTW